jgi:hypothetical protein
MNKLFTLIFMTIMISFSLAGTPKYDCPGNKDKVDLVERSAKKATDNCNNDASLELIQCEVAADDHTHACCPKGFTHVCKNFDSGKKNPRLKYKSNCHLKENMCLNDTYMQKSMLRFRQDTTEAPMIRIGIIHL